MSNSREQLWLSLLSAGLVQGPEPSDAELTSPWYVKVLLGFSGWLAALFLLGFIGVGFAEIIKNEVAAIITGIVMIGIAYAMLRVARNEFVEHLALAVSLAGQALVTIGIFQIFERHDGISWTLLAIFEIPLMLFIPNFVHRVITTLVATLGFYMALNAVGMTFVFSGVILFAAAWLWLNEFQRPRSIRMLQAIGYGLVLALIPLKGSALFGYRSLGWHEARVHAGAWVQPWMAELLTAAVFIYVVWRLLQRYQHTDTQSFTIAALFAALVISLASFQAQGITVGIVILLLGFAVSNRILLGVGIVALLFFISSYYYLLNTTLLVKAINLFGIGLVLLGARWLLLRWLPGARETRHG